MTMLLLIVHFFSFSLGIGCGFANMVVGRTAAKADPAARPFLGAASRMIGQIATLGLILLWLTGIALVFRGWDSLGGLPKLFWLKIAAVLVLTGISVLMNLHGIRASRSGTPPPAETMKKLGMLGGIASTTAMVLAVLAFEMS